MSTEKRNKIILLHWNGRFGNRMFTYVFLKHYAEKFNLDIWVPSKWEGDYLFDHPGHQIIPDAELRLYLNQTMPELDNLDARMNAIYRYNQRTGDNVIYMNPDEPGDYGKVNVCIDSLCSYHSSIFTRYSRDKILNEYCRFSPALKASPLFRKMEAQKGSYIIAHLRRDDIANAQNVSNQGYSLISLNSYEKAFEKYGYQFADVNWVTDDRTGQWGVQSVRYEDYWSYPEGSMYYDDVVFSWFEDFLKLMFARVIFRANSSFSWWAAFLSSAIVYAPRLDKRILFHESLTETDFDFEEGNHPHWLCITGRDQCDDIHIR